MRRLLPLLWFLLPTTALAHPIDEVTGEAALDLHSPDGRDFDLTVVLSHTHLEAYTRLVRDLGLPPERDRLELARTVQHAFAFSPCEVQPRTEGPIVTEEASGAMIGLHYRLTCAQPPKTLEVRRIGYRQAKTRTTLYLTVRIADRPGLQWLIPPRLESMTLDLTTGATRRGETLRGRMALDSGQGAMPSDTASASLPASRTHAAWWQPPPALLLRAWAQEGALHLLTGWDHLLFLLTLVLAAGRLRALVLAVTAFSVGHLASMTAALLLHLPAPAWWDVLIGLTIAASAWRARQVADRQATTLALAALGFGLVHGLGFGAGLQALTGGFDRLAWPLLSFGLGLDFAQLAWVTLAWTVWIAARRTAGDQLPRWQVTAAMALMVAGLGAGVWAAASA